MQNHHAVNGKAHYFSGHSQQQTVSHYQRVHIVHGYDLISHQQHVCDSSGIAFFCCARFLLVNCAKLAPVWWTHQSTWWENIQEYLAQKSDRRFWIWLSAGKCPTALNLNISKYPGSCWKWRWFDHSLRQHSTAPWRWGWPKKKSSFLPLCSVENSSFTTNTCFNVVYESEPVSDISCFIFPGCFTIVACLT